MAINRKRLIDADKIVNGIALYMAENAYLNDTPLDVLKMVANWITDATTVDAVPVVRCENCRYWERELTIVGVSNNGYCLCHNVDGIEADDFCSYGERKVK